MGRTGFRRDVGAWALLAGLVALFFWRLWAPNPLDRVTFPVGDFTDQYYPLRHFVANELARGRLPFWNPYIFGGQPGLADPQAAVLYPITLFNSLLWGARYSLGALVLEVVAHVLVAAWGCYLFARRGLGFGGLPSLVAAIIFGFGGYLTGFPLEQVTILAVAAWLPWLLWGVRVASTDDGARAWLGSAGAAVALGMALLAGHPQTALYVVYTGLAYALFLLVQRRAAGGTGARALRLGAALLLGVGLAAAQLIPSLFFISESSRQQLDYVFVSGGLDWEELTTLFIPKVVGSTPLYAGVVTLILIPVGLLAGRRQPETRFWGGLSLVGLLLALGANSFVFDLFYLGLPGLSRVRSQERVLLLWALGAALLAAWGVAALQREEGRARTAGYLRWLITLAPVLVLPWLLLWWLRAVLFSQAQLNAQVFDAFFSRYTLFLVLYALGLVWLYLARSRGVGGIVAILLVGLLVWDLFTVNRATHIGGPATGALRPPNGLVATLGALDEPFRVGVVGATNPGGNDGMRYGLELLSGNEPLRLDASERFYATVAPWQQLLLSNARYVVADRDLGAETPDAYETISQDGGTFLVRLRPEIPYAWSPDRVEASWETEYWERLAAPDYPLFEVAQVERALPPLAGDAEVTLLDRAPGRARLQVRAAGPEPALVVIAEPEASGWRAEIGGAPVETLRANGLHLALVVPPGDHVVEVSYRPPLWPLAVAISGASLLGILALGARGIRRE